MNETSGSSTTTSTLPTLGDDPSNGLRVAPVAPPRRRFARKLIMASVVGLLLLTSGTAALAVSGGSFNDVGTGNPFAEDIEWMAGHEITTGYPDGTFRPEAPVTRQSMAAFIHRLNTQTEKVTKSLTFTAQTMFSEIATCPEGKRPISGGGGTSQQGVMITDSYEDGVSWHIRWESKTGGPVTGTGSVFVICQPTA